MKEELEVNTCRICNNNEGNITYTAREMMYGLRDEFLYFQCSNCNCLQISKFPKDMSKYYPQDYYSFEKHEGKKFKGILGKIKRKQYMFLINGGKVLRGMMSLFSGKNVYFIFQNLNVNSNTKILDVGCGNGSSFLYPLSEMGFKNLQGCDPFLKTPLLYDNGLHINNSNIFEIEGTWGVITYHHSFEHIPNPLEHMKKIYELLKPNGVCIVRIPTVSSFAWEHYGTNWVQLDAPRHFFLHSKNSMRILGEKSKLELYDVVYDSSHFQFSGSEKYLKDTPLLATRPKGIIKLIRRKINKWQYIRKAKLLNKEGKGDQAAFFFRRNDSQTSANNVS